MSRVTEEIVREQGTRAGWPAGIVAGQKILHIAFAFIPILAGLDKYFHFFTEWERYLNPAVAAAFPGGAEAFMRTVGVIEIAAGLLVGFLPAIGGAVVGVWILGVAINLATMPQFYDLALRDFGLSLGAFALAAVSVGMRSRR